MDFPSLSYGPALSCTTMQIGITLNSSILTAPHEDKLKAAINRYKSLIMPGPICPFSLFLPSSCSGTPSVIGHYIIMYMHVSAAHCIEWFAVLIPAFQHTACDFDSP